MSRYIQVFSMLFACVAVAGTETNAGPEGGTVVGDASHRFEVKIDPDGKEISVTTLQAKRGAPKRMAVTLFRESGSGRTVDLKTITMNPGGLPKFQGELSPNAGSVVGVELRFETSLKTLRVLKLVPYIPPRPSR